MGNENREAGPLQGGALQSKQRLEVTVLENKQSCEEVLGGGVLEGKQSQEVHHKGSVQENRQNHGCQQGAGGTLGKEQSCKGNQEVGASQSIHMGQVQCGTGESKQDSEKHLDIGALEIEQIQEHVEGSVLESQKTGDRYLKHITFGSNESNGGCLHVEGGMVESEPGHSNGSQWIEGAQKRPSNDGSHKTKPSPTKKQKAEEF